MFKAEASEVNKDKWLQCALQRGPLTNWEGKRTATFSVSFEEQHGGITCTLCHVIQITKAPSASMDNVQRRLP